MVKIIKKPSKTVPYIPFKTFTGFIDKLHSTAVPSIIDSSLLETMSGSMKGQLLSSLRFLNLVGVDNVVNESLINLIKAYKTDAWETALKGVFMESYHEITDKINLHTGTAQQLNDSFKKLGNIDGQMLDKAIRFYLTGLENSGTKYSPFFKAKKARKAGPRKLKKDKKKNRKDNGDDFDDDDMGEEEETPSGKREKIEISIPGKKSFSVRLPANMDKEDWEMVKSMLDGFSRYEFAARELALGPLAFSISQLVKSIWH